jgi:cytochrome d ubiquinol oxidase subunit II
LIEPDITIYSAAAPRITLALLLGALAAGTVLLFPSYYYLFRVFKRKTALVAIPENPDKAVG